MTVHITTFEIIGEGRELADDIQQRRQEASAKHWDFVREVGGEGYFPDKWTGGIRSVLFANEVPKGWRRMKRTHKELVEGLPKKTTKAGQALLEQMAALPRQPTTSSLASDLGYNPASFAMDGTSIYFPTEVRVEHPETRHFLRLPLTSDDGFDADPDFLRAVPESELMKAVEDHNAEARRLRVQEDAE